ncbi:hypothetical protein BDW74DRAFT_175604 [Aspergillus multicolor]|uniref:uncharacterized protein n=1 Tax=Aspergillus multicolor TaxID=41759 RepID=UPI003CCD3CAB
MHLSPIQLTTTILALTTLSKAQYTRWTPLPADLHGNITADVASAPSGTTYCLFGDATLVTPNATNGLTCQELYTSDAGVIAVETGTDQDQFLIIEVSSGTSGLEELVFNDENPVDADGLEWRGVPVVSTIPIPAGQLQWRKMQANVGADELLQDEQRNVYESLALFDTEDDDAEPVYGPFWSVSLGGGDAGTVYAYNQYIIGASQATLAFTAE